MKNIFLFIGAGLAFSSLLMSCDKDDDKTTEKERLLAQREWKITSIKRKSLLDPTADSSILKPCTTDDRLSFAANGQFQLKDGATKCDSTIFQYDQGTWAFNGGETVLNLNGSKKVQAWKIVLLNDSLMNVQWLDSIAPTNKVLKTISFKNK